VIDISSISTAEKGLWHIGKTKSRTLLKVRYSTGDVTEDTAAWLVGDPERWISEINGMK
jgi:CRISPR/Cas system CSM-associated protein Csm3 (group 7 of RAMP superfamily)